MINKIISSYSKLLRIVLNVLVLLSPDESVARKYCTDQDLCDGHIISTMSISAGAFIGRLASLLITKKMHYSENFSFDHICKSLFIK